jgi:D-3-phosphoglycerate dehydrogenase
MTRVLLTTTSFQDVPGPHHQQLKEAGYELVTARGPLPESEMLKLVGDVDAFLCGDDEITPKVIDKALPRLKVISKYGIGLDKIDIKYATEKKIPITFCPGVNHTTVAEHTFLLLLSITKNFLEQANAVRAGNWKRVTGTEILGKHVGILGLGRIGKEVAIRAKAFGMPVSAYDIYWDEAFAKAHDVKRVASKEEIFSACDVISLHTNLDESTRDMINAKSLATMKKSAIILNCARGELVNTKDIAEALNSGRISGYGTDVLDHEPPAKDHVLLTAKNCVITPHVGSRTHESVQRQAGMAATNLINVLSGKAPLAQANKI